MQFLHQRSLTGASSKLPYARLTGDTAKRCRSPIYGLEQGCAETEEVASGARGQCTEGVPRAVLGQPRRSDRPLVSPMDVLLDPTHKPRDVELRCVTSEAIFDALAATVLELAA